MEPIHDFHRAVAGLSDPTVKKQHLPAQQVGNIYG